MPKWYRLNTSGTWQPLANVYRLNTGGIWQKLKKIYRLDSSGNWNIIHSSADFPQINTPPVLQTQGGSTTTFTQIDTITLDRGTWDYMDSSYAPTSYYLQIQVSTTGTSGWSDVATGTGTSISYPITLSDASTPSYYFRGRVTATNENGSTTTVTTPVRSNILVSIYLNGDPVIDSTSIFISWTVARPSDTNYLSSQKVEVFSTYTNTLLYTANVSTSLNYHSIPTSSLPSSTLVYIKVTVVASDSALTQNVAYTIDFYTPMSGTVSITPSSSDRVEAGTSVSALLSGWPPGTTFTYLWKWQNASGTIFNLSSSSSLNVPSASGTLIWVEVVGTYAGQTKGVVSTYHRIHPQAPSFTLSGTEDVLTISSVSATGATYYYGSYSGPISGNIPETSTAGTYSITGLVAGTYTVTLYARGYLSSTAYNSYNFTSKNQIMTGPVYAGPFNITSVTKGKLGAVVASKRRVTASWQTSTNAAAYEIQVEGSSDNSTWTVLQTLQASPYIYAPTTTGTYDADYYKYYRVAARARTSNYDVAYASYNNGGSLNSLQYVSATGTAPGAPTINTITVTTTTADISFTHPLDTGSNTIDWIQLSLDQVTWYNDYTSPYQFGGLSPGTNYTVYVRALNYDGLYSSVVSQPFTTSSVPTNTVLPSITSSTSDFRVGAVLTVNTGTWNNANSYTRELLFDTTDPVPTTASTKALDANFQYTITYVDALNPSYRFRPKVTAYSQTGQSGASAIAYGNTSARSYIVPTTTVSVGTATSNGFTISGTAGPVSGGVAYINLTEIQIWNSSQTSYTSITSGLPSINTTTGSWSYVWTGGSSSTTYYAKAVVKSKDTDLTTYTSGFSSSITTSAPLTAPSGGSLNSNTVSSGTDGRIGVTYAVSINTEATGSPTPTKAYQWQVFNGPSSSYVNLTGATSSTYTVPWTASDSLGNTVQMPSQLIRCRVTWSNSQGSQVVNSSSNQILPPTITGITATVSLATPYITYYNYGYNFRSIGSKNSYGTTNPPSTTDASYTYSQPGNSTIPITRLSNNGGDLFYYSLEVIPYTTTGTGAAPTAGTISGTTRFTNVIRNNATNRTNSPVNVYGTGSA